MKKLLLFIFALFLWTGAWAEKTVYLKLGVWDPGSFAAYAWGGSTTAAFYDMEPVDGGTNCYKATIPDDCTKILFTRGNNENVKDWDNMWNQTDDYDIVADNTIYVINSYHGGSSWPNHENNKSTAYTTTNLSLLGTATASYAYGDAHLSNDGNNNTRWGSNGGTDTEWYQVGWAVAHTFNTIKILCEGAMNHTYSPGLAFDIQTSDDGNTWTTRKHVWGKNGDGTYISVVLNEPVTAQYVRFQGLTKGDGGLYGYSFWEFEVYNLDYSGETLNSITLSAYKNHTTTNVGKNIALSVIGYNSSSEEIPTGIISWSDVSSIGNVANETFNATTEGTATLTATAGGKSSAGISITVHALQILSSISLPQYVFSATEGKGGVVVTALNQDGDPYDDELTLSWKDNKKPVGAENSGLTLTFGAASGAGTYTLQISDGTTTLSKDLYFIGYDEIPSITDDPSNIVISMSTDANDVKVADEGWDGGYKNLGDLTFIKSESPNIKALHAKDVGIFYFKPKTDTDFSAAKKLHVDVYSTAKAIGTLNITSGKGLSKQAVALVPGWNSIEYDVAAATNTTITAEGDADFIKFDFRPTKDAEILVTNAYFSTVEASYTLPYCVVETDGTVQVTGPFNSTKKSDLNVTAYANVKLFDLRAAKIDSETGVITTQSDNGVVMVNQSYVNFLAGTKNLCYVSNGAWIAFPKNGETPQTVTFVDNKPLYTGHLYANDNDVVMQYSRNLAADSYVTFSFPTAVEVPENVEVYTFSDYDDSEHTITFTKSDITTLVKNTPYVLHATTATSISFNQKPTEALDMKTPGTVVNSGATLHANYDVLTTDGSQYILSSGTFYKGNGIKVGTFRAYLTGVTGAAEGKGYAVFVDADDETTKIGTIDANGEINVMDGAVYNLAGQRVAHPTKGLYIVNGKKVIIK